MAMERIETADKEADALISVFWRGSTRGRQERATVATDGAAERAIQRMLARARGREDIWYIRGWIHGWLGATKPLLDIVCKVNRMM